jgi:hypothetical protein
VRLFDLVRRDKAALPKQKLAELARMFDLWDLRSFRRQNRRERAWNAATRLLPALTWMVKYDYKKQLYPDLAAGVAVSFLIVPQARPLASRLERCNPRMPTRCSRLEPDARARALCAQGLSYAGVAGLPAIHGLCASASAHTAVHSSRVPAH